MDALEKYSRQAIARRSLGISLIELIVVLAIIVMLIGLLMPALSSAKEKSRQVKCLATLRSIGQAAQAHVNDHHGYLPTGGWQWACTGGECNPAGLDDAQERRFMYYVDAGIKRPLPVTAALAEYMGITLRTESRSALSDDLQNGPIRERFHCPSQEIDLSGWTERGSTDGSWTAPDEYSSYVFNEAMIGRRENPQTGPGARMVACRDASGVFFAMDGRPRDNLDDRWLMVFNYGDNDTLADFESKIKMSRLGRELLDYWRHQMRVNVLFLDGHCQTLGMSPGGLGEIGVSRGIN